MRRYVDVLIATESGPLETESTLVSAVWGCVLYKGRWSVTHLPSGRALMTCDAKVQAESMVLRLAKYFPNFRADEEFTSVPMVKLGSGPQDQKLISLIKQFKSEGAGA